MDEKKYWLALSTHPQIGARTIGKLYKRFNKLSRLWAENIKIESSGLDLIQIAAVREVILKVDPDKELRKVQKLDIKIITLPDKNYPKILKEIADPPAILYLKGTIKPQDEIALAVVGSRKFTNYGQRVADDLVYKLAANGLTIISGLALGIDALAHQSALSAKGRTIAVLPCGLDQIYPSANSQLADKILQSGGAIISEFPLGTITYRSNFPIRNRIIAGLSLGTLIIEGTTDSGSLITAQAAINYNREVFAIPGEIYSATSEGPNKLIQMGAKLVINHSDILNELNISQLTSQKDAQLIIPDSPEEKIILSILTKPTIVDQLVRLSKMDPSIVNSTLIMLEMKGMIKNLGGTSYVIRGKLK